MATDPTVVPGALAASGPIPPIGIGPEHLASARFVQPSTIQLVFLDGFSAPLAIELLEMPADRIDWSTVRVSPNGDQLLFQGINGDPVPIDAATLRYLVDRTYAATMDAKLKGLQFSEEELERIARDNPPPPEWFAQPPRDLTRESWK